MKKAAAAVALFGAGTAVAQPFPPGYVDPVPLLAAAAQEIGGIEMNCVTFSGTGYAGAVGQTYENAVNIDWPRIDSLANYTRTINWEAGTSVETFDRKPGLNPAAWKYAPRTPRSRSLSPVTPPRSVAPSPDATTTTPNRKFTPPRLTDPAAVAARYSRSPYCRRSPAPSRSSISALNAA